MTSAYRSRNPGHDYYGRGTYLVTLVVSGRERRQREKECPDLYPRDSIRRISS